jgi:anti-sigma regulatory factor (Ser/Thr protein kinase)
MSPDGGISVLRGEHDQETGFRHEALLYSGGTEFIDQATSFVRAGVAANESVLVAVPEPKVEMIRTRLGGVADRVQFADMTELGHNPTHIIPAWRRFVTEHSGHTRPIRGIGEPIWAGRSQAELVEAQGHESLLNLALADVSGLWLLCPYDVGALGPSVIEEAHRSHPIVVRDGVRQPSSTCRDSIAMAAAPFLAPLSEPDSSRELVFEIGSLAAVRRFVSSEARKAGLDPSRTSKLVLAVNEVTTNTIRHAGGSGLLRMWRDAVSVVCEVRDRGRLEQPLVGREYPALTQEGGRGLWIVNQVCDLVQVRTLPSGTIVRLHFRLAS